MSGRLLVRTLLCGRWLVVAVAFVVYAASVVVVGGVVLVEVTVVVDDVEFSLVVVSLAFFLLLGIKLCNSVAKTW